MKSKRRPAWLGFSAAANEIARDACVPVPGPENNTGNYSNLRLCCVPRPLSNWVRVRDHFGGRAFRWSCQDFPRSIRFRCSDLHTFRNAAGLPPPPDQHKRSHIGSADHAAMRCSVVPAICLPFSVRCCHVGRSSAAPLAAYAIARYCFFLFGIAFLIRNLVCLFPKKQWRRINN